MPDDIQLGMDFYGPLIRKCREEIAACDARRAAWELRLAELLAASGRRPGEAIAEGYATELESAG